MKIKTVSMLRNRLQDIPAVCTQSVHHHHEITISHFSGAQSALKDFERVCVGMQRDAKIFLPVSTDRQQYPHADFDNLLLGSPHFRSDLVNWTAISDAADTGVLSPRDQALLWDLILFGDGGAFVDRIVTPVFRHAMSNVDVSIWASQARCTIYGVVGLCSCAAPQAQQGWPHIAAMLY